MVDLIDCVNKGKEFWQTLISKDIFLQNDKKSQMIKWFLHFYSRTLFEGKVNNLEMLDLVFNLTEDDVSEIQKHAEQTILLLKIINGYLTCKVKAGLDLSVEAN